VSLTKHPRGSTVTDPALVRRAVKAAALGNAMEWFDFGVYSYIAVTLGKVFFPSGNPTALPGSAPSVEV
jgi:MHS family proline/betaine transporter-like MFS transporter